MSKNSQLSIFIIINFIISIKLLFFSKISQEKNMSRFVTKIRQIDMYSNLRRYEDLL